MTNSQLTFRSKLRRLGRKLKVHQTPDPDGVIAVLSIARRLVKEHGLYPSEALDKAAEKYAAPIDHGRSFWAAHYALAMTTDPLKLDKIEDIDLLLGLFDEAIQKQGEMNLKARRK